MAEGYVQARGLFHTFVAFAGRFLTTSNAIKEL
jgi:hypothetical protein